MGKRAEEKCFIGAIVEYFGSYEVPCLFLYRVRGKKALKVEHEIALRWRQGEWCDRAGEFKFGDNYHTPVDGREIPEEDFRVLEKYVNTVYRGEEHV